MSAESNGSGTDSPGDMCEARPSKAEEAMEIANSQIAAFNKVAAQAKVDLMIEKAQVQIVQKDVYEKIKWLDLPDNQCSAPSQSSSRHGGTTSATFRDVFYAIRKCPKPDGCKALEQVQLQVPWLKSHGFLLHAMLQKDIDRGDKLTKRNMSDDHVALTLTRIRAMDRALERLNEIGPLDQILKTHEKKLRQSCGGYHIGMVQKSVDTPPASDGYSRYSSSYHQKQILKSALQANYFRKRIKDLNAEVEKIRDLSLTQTIVGYDEGQPTEVKLQGAELQKRLEHNALMEIQRAPYKDELRETQEALSHLLQTMPLLGAYGRERDEEPSRESCNVEEGICFDVPGGGSSWSAKNFRQEEPKWLKDITKGMGLPPETFTGKHPAINGNELVDDLHKEITDKSLKGPKKLFEERVIDELVSLCQGEKITDAKLVQLGIFEQVMRDVGTDSLIKQLDSPRKDDIDNNYVACLKKAGEIEDSPSVLGGLLLSFGCAVLTPITPSALVCWAADVAVTSKEFSDAEKAVASMQTQEVIGNTSSDEAESSTEPLKLLGVFKTIAVLGFGWDAIDIMRAAYKPGVKAATSIVTKTRKEIETNLQRLSKLEAGPRSKKSLLQVQRLKKSLEKQFFDLNKALDRNLSLDEMVTRRVAQFEEGIAALKIPNVSDRASEIAAASRESIEACLKKHGAGSCTPSLSESSDRPNIFVYAKGETIHSSKRWDELKLATTPTKDDLNLADDETFLRFKEATSKDLEKIVDPVKLSRFYEVLQTKLKACAIGTVKKP